MLFRDTFPDPFVEICKLKLFHSLWKAYRRYRNVLRTTLLSYLCLVLYLESFNNPWVCLLKTNLNYAGGVNSDMLKKLPSSIRSKFGFQVIRRE
jgi:hypothetical protein